MHNDPKIKPESAQPSKCRRRYDESVYESTPGGKRLVWGAPISLLRLVSIAMLALGPSGCGQQDPQGGPSGVEVPANTRPSRTEDANLPERPGRIILFSMDTVRADRVSGYGTATTTPNLDEIAAEGARFTDFYAAASFTLPATMSIFTGLDALEHGLWNEAAVLAPDVPTLAELLRKAGYRTQAFHEGGYVDAEFGFDRGFDRYVAYPQRKVVEESLWSILDWMRSASGEPYFLFLHTYAAHDPYGGFDLYRREHPERGLPTQEEIEQWRRKYPKRESGATSHAATTPAEIRKLCTLFNQLANDNSERLGCGYNYLPAGFPDTPQFDLDRSALLRAYDDRIRSIDRAIGQIRSLLLELGQWDDTLFIITSDHGEAFFEHGLYRHDQVPFNEVLKIPLIISYPRLLRERGVRNVTSVTWHLDLLPTILSLASVPYPGKLRGIDLTPRLIEEANGSDDRVVFPGVLRIPNEGMEPIRRVAVGSRFKFIEGHVKFGDSEGLLFDLRESPGERANLRTERVEIFNESAERVRGYERDLEFHPAIHRTTRKPITQRPGEFSARFTLSPEEEEALRALGYRD
jgi:arylsulfatase A-like enzyme